MEDELVFLQKKFVELDKQKEEYKKFLEEYKDTIDQLVDKIGVGGHFQDDDGIVYQIDVPDGKFVYFDKYTINRTRREGERSGSLSIKKAKDLGYNVK